MADDQTHQISDSAASIIAGARAALRRDWEENKAEYRDAENYPGTDVVHEGTDMVIVADHTQTILPQILRDRDEPYQAVKRAMKQVAHEKVSCDWDGSDPLVFPKVSDLEVDP